MDPFVTYLYYTNIIKSRRTEREELTGKGMKRNELHLVLLSQILKKKHESYIQGWNST